MGSNSGKIVFFFLLITILASLGYIGYVYNIFSPDFFKCRDFMLRPVKTGAFEQAYNQTFEGRTISEVFGCFMGFEKTEDKTFPDTSLGFKMGFFDKVGRLHSYSARIGGSFDDGKTMPFLLCTRSGNEEFCRIVEELELRETLKTGDVLHFEILERDEMEWVPARQAEKYKDIISGIKKSALTGTGFPAVPKEDDFVLQVWTIRKL